MTFIVLLRGVNVGGNKMIAMAALRDALEKMGYTGVKTLLQSGNVVFQSKAVKPVALEVQLEKDIEKRLGLRADFHVRTPDEWRAIVSANPFKAEARSDPSRLIVTFFKHPLAAAKVSALQSAITGPERVRADGRHLYMTYPDGMGNSKAAPLVERLLAARGTARNWNTILKLGALAEAYH